MARPSVDTSSSSCNNNNTNQQNSNFLQQAETLIPADVYLISGCEDHQTSADVGNGASQSSHLPHPKGRASGACTSALLEVLHSAQSQAKPQPLSFQQVLMQLRDKLNQQGHSQIPQLTSSRPLDLEDTPFSFAGAAMSTGNSTNSSLPPQPTRKGRNRALLVGIHYNGQSGALHGCHNDVHHMRQYLIEVCQFAAKDILVLMDDDASGTYHPPTRDNVIKALRRLVTYSCSGDAVFFHYSGHGGLLSPDYNSWKQKQQQQQQQLSTATMPRSAASLSETKQCYDQTLIPVDHSSAGQIRDFSLFHHFVRPMAAGVTVTCLMDCCFSGSVLDLPYSYRPTQTGRGNYGSYAMHQNMSVMSNLAFLYLLGGGALPVGIFDNVTNNLQEALGGTLDDYQGMLDGTLAEETGEAAAAGTEDTNIGDPDDDNGGLDDANVDAGDEGLGLDEGGSEYPDAGETDNESTFAGGEDAQQQFGGEFDGDNAGCADYDVGDGDEGCGNEGCGDLFAAFADCLNDA